MSIQKDFLYKIEDSLYDEEEEEAFRRIRSHVKNEIEEEIEEMIVNEEPPALGTQHHYFGGKKSKEDFLKSKGLHDRPNSHMAIKAWEDYQDSFYDI